jgi:hypothetical protein
VVLINGIPGPWIQCKRGLRQGDALSPYLFLLVADVLQQLIKSNGSVRHPLSDSACPVLKYADDTIILIRAEANGVARLRSILDMFSAVTGLKINYDKSTITPMHLLEGAQLKVDNFLHTYLGLPLSNVKLSLSAFTPLIARIDRYLATWQALLLATAGRVVLVNAVLTGVPTYAIGAMLLPPGVLAAIDARRRAFLWTGSDHTSGAQCLVAWENICRAKEDSGLGVKRLDTQNACLLLKLIHRLHHPHGSS